MTFILHEAIAHASAVISSMPLNTIIGIGIATSGLPIGLLIAVINETRDALR